MRSSSVGGSISAQSRRSSSRRTRPKPRRFSPTSWRTSASTGGPGGRQPGPQRHSDLRNSVSPLERLLLGPWAVQLLRILVVAWLFSSLGALGRLVHRLLELSSEEAPDRRLIEVALGFGVYSAI